MISPINDPNSILFKSNAPKVPGATPTGSTISGATGVASVSGEPILPLSMGGNRVMKNFLGVPTPNKPISPITTPTTTADPVVAPVVKKPNLASDFNREVDANRGLGMNEEDAYNAAMAKKKANEMISGTPNPVTPPVVNNNTYKPGMDTSGYEDAPTTPVTPAPTTPTTSTPGVPMDENTAQTIDGVVYNPLDPDPIKAQAARDAIRTKNAYDRSYGNNQVDTDAAINDANRAYIVAQGDYEKNKAYIPNFDVVNGSFNSVITERRKLQDASGNITDAQAQEIAGRLGLTPEEVKNPTKIFEKFEFTEEGKRKLGITGYTDRMTDAETNFNRQKEDAATNLAIATQNIDNQIADIQKQMDRNINWMTASGAWSGSLKSSGYLAGIENVRQDGQTTVNRLKTMLEQVKTADTKNVGRLTEDYNLAVGRAKQGFDDQLKDLQHNTGLTLNSATTKYSAGSTELRKALDDIAAKFGGVSMDITAKYISTMRDINLNTQTLTENAFKLIDLNDKQANKRYSEYIADNGNLLQNTTMATLQAEVDSGKISFERMKDLRNTITTSIQKTLGANANVSQDDLNTIQHLLNSGKTPMEVIAAMQEMPKFSAGKIQEIKTTDAVGNNIIQSGYFKDGEWTPVTPTNTGGGRIVRGGTESTATGSSLMQMLASGKAEDGSKFFGLYASGDPTGVNRRNEYEKMSKIGIAADLAKFPTTKITEEMINESAAKTGIDPIMIATILKLDSSYGTAGKGARNNNPGNVGQTDTLDAQGITVKGYPTLQAGVDAVAGNLKKRLDALVASGKYVIPKANTSPQAYTANEKLLLNKMMGGSATEADRKAFAAAGLDSNDINAYQAQKDQEDALPPMRSPEDYSTIILASKANELQSKSKNYADRMNLAANALLASEKQFSDRSYMGQEWQTNAPNVMKSGDQQSMEANKQNFITAVLRQESGASIAPTEFAKEEKKYFPQPGDTKATIAEKQNAREFAIKSMYSQAGKDEKGKPISDFYVPKKIYEDGSYIKYDNQGNYNWIDKNGKESGWKKIGQVDTSTNTPTIKPSGGRIK